MKTGASLTALKISKGLKQKDLAESIGVSGSYISKLESEPNEPLPDSIVERIESKIGLLPEMESRSEEIVKVTRDIPVEKDITIPLHWQAVPAGNLEQIVAENYDEFNLSKRYQNTFAVYIRGDSMIGAGIENDDIVVFREASMARHGQVVYACVNDRCTVKVYTQKGDELPVLKPANKNYQPIYIQPGDTLVIRGVFLNLIREAPQNVNVDGD